MLVIVSYDVATAGPIGQRRLRNVAKTCVNYGQRVQNSVFECHVDPALWVAFRQKLIDIINEDEDSLRFYFLGTKWHGKVEHIGAKSVPDLSAPLIL